MTETRDLEYAPPDPEHEALAASLPQEWVKAAESWYSMHGSGLVRNILAGVVPLIQAAEKVRADEAERKLAAVETACRNPERAVGRRMGGIHIPGDRLAEHVLAIISGGEDGRG